MLIDKLFFMFQAETKDADDKIRKSRKGVDDVEKSLEDVEKQSKKSLQQFAALAKGAVGFFLAASAAGKTFRTAMDLADDIYVMDEISQRSRIAIEDVDGLSRAIVSMGGDLSTARGNIGSLADAFMHMQNPMEGVLNLADEIAGLDYQQAAFMLEGFGISDKATIELMRQGRDELGRLINSEKENSNVTAEMTQNALAFRQTMTAFRVQIGDTTRGFTNAFLPAINWVIGALTTATKWLTENKNVAVGFFTAVAVAVTAFFVPAMLTAAAATLAATWPFILIGVAIGAAAAMFALIYDDIMAFIAGNDSLIGQIVEKFPIVGKIFQMVGATIREAIALAVAAFDWLVGGVSNIIERVSAIESIPDAFRAMADGIIAIFKWMWSVVGAYFDFIYSGIEKIKGAVGWVAKKLGFSSSEDQEESEEQDSFDSIIDVAAEAEMSPEQIVRIEEEERESPVIRVPQNEKVEIIPDAPEYIVRQPDAIEHPQENNNRRTDVDSYEDIYHPRNRNEEYDLSRDIPLAQSYVQAAEQSPANSISTSTIRNQNYNNVEQNLAIGEVIINTQATDAEGIARETRNELQDQLERMQAENARIIER